MATASGSIRLFRLGGIDVYLHWAWFIAAAYFIHRAKGYSSPIWSVLEYLALFGIVLLHEFGHALACRAVGGKANQIVLWPLGGVAYVTPPPRPGPQLISIAAGPMVNVVLAGMVGGVVAVSTQFGLAPAGSDLRNFFYMVFAIAVALLVFNLLPIYPLDGGQIVRSLLWFVLGPAKSLMVTCIVSFVGIAGLILVAILAKSVWLGILSAFVLASCWGGLVHARALLRISQLPRRTGVACPACGAAPPLGAVWRCRNCNNQFDPFGTAGVCTTCGATFAQASCPECGSVHTMDDWIVRSTESVATQQPESP
ncbi:MAG: M50 family metallopeptidase [Verrucomicrobiae bacterium]|nr:M50 family metallopeptidase [Verrucomicrobiae bacterium]